MRKRKRKANKAFSFARKRNKFNKGNKKVDKVNRLSEADTYVGISIYLGLCQHYYMDSNYFVLGFWLYLKIIFFLLLMQIVLLLRSAFIWQNHTNIFSPSL